MRERVVQLGRSASLVGVLSEPTGVPGAEVVARPMVIFINSGIMHRVGACRMYVQAARALASAGFAVLRFDLSGIGDSEPRKDALPFEESAALEVREAMDFLEQRGGRRFVLMGLCSGADVAHQVAVQDGRVVGIGVIDPYAYRTVGYWLHHYLPKLRNARAWKRWFRVRADRLRGAASTLTAEQLAAQAEGASFDVPKYVRVFPPRDTVARELRTLVGRGVAMLAIFTNGQPDDINHQGQYRRSFRDVPFGSLLDELFIPRASHILTDLGHQRLAVETIHAWTVRTFGGSGHPLSLPEARLAARPSRPSVPLGA